MNSKFWNKTSLFLDQQGALCVFQWISCRKTCSVRIRYGSTLTEMFLLTSCHFENIFFTVLTSCQNWTLGWNNETNCSSQEMNSHVYCIRYLNISTLWCSKSYAIFSMGLTEAVSKCWAKYSGRRLPLKCSISTAIGKKYKKTKRILKLRWDKTSLSQKTWNYHRSEKNQYIFTW